jgi:hypothetical protein
LKQQVNLVGPDGSRAKLVAVRHLHQTAAAAAHAFCASTEGLKMEPYHGQCVVAITAALALENEVPDRYLAELRTM